MEENQVKDQAIEEKFQAKMAELLEIAKKKKNHFIYTYSLLTLTKREENSHIRKISNPKIPKYKYNAA